MSGKRIKEVSNRPLLMLLTGDFNYPDINCDAIFALLPSAHPTNLFLETWHDFFFIFVPAYPSSYHISIPSILDLLTNEEGMINVIKCLPRLSSSDYLIFQFTAVCYAAPCYLQIDCKHALCNADFNIWRRRKEANLIGSPSSSSALSLSKSCIASLIVSTCQS